MLWFEISKNAVRGRERELTERHEPAEINDNTAAGIIKITIVNKGIYDFAHRLQ